MSTQAHAGRSLAMSLIDADPTVEALLGDSLPRAARPLSARERGTELILGGLLLGAVAAMAAAFTSGPDLDLWTAAILVAVYALAERVQFDIGGGYTVPTQVVLVPMLLLLPTAYVPLFVAGGLLLGRLPDYLRGTHPSRPSAARALRRLARRRARARPCLLGYEAPSLGDWPLLALALGGQVVFDALLRHDPRLARARRAAGAPAAPARLGLRRRRRALAGRRPGRLAGGGPAGGAAARPAARSGLLALFARERARAHRPRARAVARLPRHRAADERPARGRRRLHRRRAQPRRRRARARGRRRARPQRPRPAQPRVRRAAARHRQDPRGRRDHQQAGQADRRRVRDRAPIPSTARRCSSASAACSRTSARSSATTTSAGTATATPTASWASRSRSPRASSAPATPTAP